MKEFLLVVAFSFWEYWLGKTKKIVANSTWELIAWGFKRLTRRKTVMEQNIKIGSIGEGKLSFEKGKVIMVASAKVDDGAIEISASITMDACVFIDQLEAFVEKKFPATAPFDPMIFGVIKSAVTSID